MASLIFWLYAYGLTWIAVIFALRGIGAARTQQFARHKSLMTTAINLILFFVVSYLAKVVILGREDRSSWSDFYLYTLYIHETFIALMLVTGAWARRLAHLFRATLDADTVPPEFESKRRRHGHLGRLCVLAAFCGLLTATIILWGMVTRLQA